LITADPRPYQVKPLEVFLSRGSILLAFDTGLGKTYTAIAAGEHLLETEQVDRVLMVVPAGLKYQWAEAIAKFTDLPTQKKRFKNEWLTIPDSRYCMVIDGTVAKRKKQYAMVQDTPSCNYLIVGYDNVINDERYVKRFGAEFAILDEATAIKTLSAGRTVAIKEKITPPWRMALTATPIDNRPDELFSIMEWVDPEVLGRGDLFDLAYIERDQYGNVTGYKNLDVLRRRLGDAMYRKSVDDPDVAPFMPDRRSLDWPVEMDPATREVYTKLAWDLLEALDESLAASGGRSFSVAAHYAGTKRPDESTPVGRAMSRHMAMEMLLDHPEVLFTSGLAYLSTDDGDDGSQYAADVVMDNDFLELTYSPKLWLLTEKLARLMDDPASKVIIFTRYRRMLELIQYVCDERGWGAVSYHGMLNTAEQQAARARFLTKPDCRVFISTHAGERGTDLPVANWLVNYDPVWSSGQADQINGRHMRTSSTHDDIFVANMYYAGSIEERKIEQQAKKRQVSRAIIDGDMPEGGIIRNDVTSLRKHVLEWLQLSDPEGMIDYEISQ
jgi:SNF2 family DNA or RNA helicase